MKKLQKKIFAVIAKCPHVKVWYFGDFFGESITLTVWNGEQQLHFDFYKWRRDDVNNNTLFKFTELLTTMEQQLKGGAA